MHNCYGVWYGRVNVRLRAPLNKMENRKWKVEIGWPLWASYRWERELVKPGTKKWKWKTGDFKNGHFPLHALFAFSNTFWSGPFILPQEIAERK